LVTLEMDPNNIVVPPKVCPTNVKLSLSSLKINTEDKNFPDEVSEEEITVIDINDNEVTLMVPKVRQCPYKCLGCRKLAEECVE
jgi:hypothetical protein